MALPLVLLGGCAAGASYALAAADPLLKTSYPTRSRYFAATVMFAGGALAPAACLFYVLFPDWSLMYLANPEQLPLIVMLPLVLVAALGAPVLGFLVAQRLILAERGRVLRFGLIGAGAICLSWVVLSWRRLLSLGYYEAFHHGGELIDLSDSRAMVLIGVALPAVLAGFVITRWSIQQHIRAIARVEDVR